ncbi:FtsK/SpoIIIE domain-containing protein, partial [Mycobacterium timonense]|uniref:FtsK/SpoIIIE domain-containing protein n=1 Tax=Mycobacterium timonense TaxID=701043 RepID=UPI0023EA527E
MGALVAASGATPGAKAVLRLPIGLIDLPYQHKQDVFSVDLTDSHLVVWGRTRSGKSVALQTLAMSAALLNDPRKVQIYGLDFGGDSKLLALEGLPHVGGVALRGDTDTVNR